MLGRTVARIELPFGYTLTVWSAGAIATYRYGLPAQGHVYLFLLGAIVAYLACAAIAFPEYDLTPPARRAALAIVNVFAVAAAATVAFVVRLLENPAAGFALAGFAGSLVYILFYSAFSYWAGRLTARR